jgi:hypothetical protein
VFASAVCILPSTAAIALVRTMGDVGMFAGASVIGALAAATVMIHFTERVLSGLCIVTVLVLTVLYGYILLNSLLLH